MMKLFATYPSLIQQFVTLILSAASPPLSSLVLLGLILAYAVKNKQIYDVIQPRYIDVVKLFCTLVLGSRVSPNHLIVSNCAGLFKKVTRDIFKEHLLPAILKALLRNPDELTKCKSLVLNF